MTKENIEKSLAGKVTGGALWLFGSYALNRLGRVAMMLVVAALLSPGEYGLIGLSMVIITVAQIVCEFGIWQSVVYRGDPDDQFLNTAFVANVVGGLLVSLGMFVAAPLVAHVYGQPMMTSLLQIMGVGLIMDAINSVPDGLLRKQLRFKSRALPEVASSIVSAVVTVTLVLAGFGVTGYALGFLAERTTRCTLTLMLVTWLPRLQLSISKLKEIISYGRYILGGDLAKHISSNLDYFIVAFVLGSQPLGFYVLCFNLANYPVSNFARILSQIAFPTFATMRDDVAQAKRVYLKMTRLVAALVIPVLTMLALLATPFVSGVLGSKWLPAVPLLQVMVVSGAFRTVSFPASDMLRAMGFQNIPFRVSIIEAFTMLAALLVVTQYGIFTVAFTVTLILSSSSLVVTIATCRAMGIVLWELAHCLVPGAVLAASGATAVLLCKYLGSASLPDIRELAALTVVATVAMGICLFTVLRRFAREVVSIAASTRSG